MAQSYNRVVLVGRLSKDPEFKTTTNGKEHCNFNIAVDKGYGREGAYFIDCSAWANTAKYVGTYLKKGSLLLVEGNVEQQIWEKDGQKQSRLVVNATSAQGLGSKAEGGNGKLPQKDVVTATMGGYEEEPINYKDIPF